MEPSLVTKDELTGLYNYRYAEEVLEKNISLAKSESLSVAVILIDIDRFTKINDNFSHQAGDLVIQQIAKLLKTTFTDGGIPCRYYFLEDLLVILPNTSLESAYDQAEKLRLAIKSLEIQYNAQTINLTASLGVVCFPNEGETVASILKSANFALYKAKNLGGDQVCIAEVPIVIDKITGLYHRCYAEKALEENFSSAYQNGLSLAIILLDLDHFQDINANFGHSFGELVLQQVGKLLKTTFKDGAIGRYWGDVFLVILPNTSYDLAYKRVEELRLAIKYLEIKYNTQPITLTASFGGVAGLNREQQRVSNIMELAEQALLKVKMAGGDQVCLHEMLMIKDTWNNLSNHRDTEKFIQDNIMLAKQRSTSVAIILINIDNLKKITDNFGPSVGDVVLQQVRTILSTIFYNHDNPLYGFLTEDLLTA